MKLLQRMSVKLLLLAVAIGVGLAQTVLAWERGLPPTEVLAPFLYVPVLGAAILGGYVPGLVMAALASFVYAMALQDQSAAVGFGAFVGLLADRATTYGVYALVAAFGSRYVERRLEKLERTDRVDDATGLANSADFLEDSELEIKRSDRYGSQFAIAEIRLERDAIRHVRRKSQARILRSVGATLRGSTRIVDRPARLEDEEMERFVIILPETNYEGCEVLAHRLDSKVRNVLLEQGVEANGSLSVRSLAYPEHRQPILELRDIAIDVDIKRRVLPEIDEEVTA
jgi:GGDEF domain-containing protein